MAKSLTGGAISGICGDRREMSVHIPYEGHQHGALGIFVVLSGWRALPREPRSVLSETGQHFEEHLPPLGDQRWPPFLWSHSVLRKSESAVLPGTASAVPETQTTARDGKAVRDVLSQEANR